jgi:adenylylsulfate kinase
MSAGAVVWFTGLPASGKTTLACLLREQLSRPVILLDSDELRATLGATGYGSSDRDAFYGVIGRLAAMLAAQGHLVLVAATASRRAYRDATRARVPRFIEVWVRTPVAECRKRDVKGLYASATEGAAPTLPGVGETYEPPLHPEVIADGGRDEGALDELEQLLGT